MFFFINNSKTFGGQEKYLFDLMKILKSNYEVHFIGRPSTDLCVSIDKITSKSVVVFNGNSALYNYIFSIPGDCFKVYVQHSSINDCQSGKFRKWIRKFLLRILITKVDLVIRVCNDALPSSYSPKKIKTVYNGVAVPNTVLPEKKSELKSLLMVGEVNDNKNQKLAIECLKYLPHYSLTIVGDGPNVDLLQRFSRDIGVSARVFWEGYQKKPELYFTTSKYLLMLSKYEAFPYVVLEAMSNSLPVISVSVGGVPEIICDENNGLLLEDYCVGTLVSKISTIVESEYLDIAHNARETIKNSFTIEKMAQSFLYEIDTGYKFKFGRGLNETSS